MSEHPPLRIIVVSHTHWDREWYHTAGRFRQRLVALVDELLGGAASVEEPFLLDGQSVVLEDYLAVRPGARAKIGRLLRDGALEAGPWYVLADELIPSAEALVRNLLAGRAVLRSLGATSPPVLYCPDSFGHPAALPLLADGFGLPLIVLWRGYGGPRWPSGDVFRWASADGASALVYHLAPDGYELGSSLPADPRGAADRWAAIRDALMPRAVAGVALLPNGADHHALQPHLRTSIAAIAAAAEPAAAIERGSLRAFAGALGTALGSGDLPEVGDRSAGGTELRDSYGYTWTLQGTLGTRAHLKRRNASVERLLVRDAEPWVALAEVGHRGVDRRALLDAAWKSLLLCHPHDTLCGCSIDDVARAMAVRLDDAESQAAGLRDDALLDVIGHDSASARTAVDAWRPVVVVSNPAARARGGVAEIEVLRFREHVRVGPGSAPEIREAGDSPDRTAPLNEAPFARCSLAAGSVERQLLERTVRHDRVESPVAYPRDDLVESERVIAWVPTIAGYGTIALDIDDAPPSEGQAASSPPAAVGAGELWLDNGLLRIAVDDAGRVSLDTNDARVSVRSLIGFEDVGDVGDLYTHSPRLPLITDVRLVGARVVHGGPLRGELHASWVMSIPRTSGRAGRSSSVCETVLHASFTLDAGVPFARVRVWGMNEACDHRLRVVFRGGIERAEVWADAAFGPVRRAPVEAPEGSSETPPPTAPLARYVTLAGAERGFTLLSDGLAEYEATPEGDIAVTLTRAVGELSRNDLPERPGHAGWPAPTPEAQSLRAFEGCFGVLPHGARDACTTAAIERSADDFLHPLCGFTLRSSIRRPLPTDGVELRLHESVDPSLEGALAFSACKPAVDGAGVVLRCVNLIHLPVRAEWRVPFPIARAQRARLDEEAIGELDVAGRAIPFVAGPREVVTVVVHASGPGARGAGADAADGGS